MKVNYQICSVKSSKTKDSLDSDQLHYYPRLMCNDVKDINYLANVVSNKASFSEVDVKGCLTSVVKQITNCLRRGETVDIEGLGRFSLNLQANPPIPSDGKPIPHSVQVEKIHFSPCYDLKYQIKNIDLHLAERLPLKAKNKQERIEIISTCIDRHKQISIMQLSQATGICYSTIRRDLDFLHKSQKIEVHKIGQNKLYSLL